MANDSKNQGDFYVVGRHQPVEIITSQGTLQGFIYVPELKRRLSEILNDERVFLPLTDVTDSDGKKIEYMAINKSHVISVREA